MKQHVYKTMDSPVGKLTLVASSEGLAAILWENDRPGRVRLTIDAQDDTHPVLLEAERQLGGDHAAAPERGVAHDGDAKR